MSKESLQSGRTRAIDLDEIESQRRKPEPEAEAWTGEKWNDPWADGPRQRSWAEDDRWVGDEDSAPSKIKPGNRTQALDLGDIKSGGAPDDDWGQAGGGGRGWSAPKRDEMVASGDGWDDWNDAGGGGGGGGNRTMAMNLEDIEEQKDLGGRRKRQAAASYERDDTAAYGEGRARRREIYRDKENLEFEDRGLQDYSAGGRRSYGAQEGNDDQFWSSSPRSDGARRPAEPEPVPTSLPPAERTVALDLLDAEAAMSSGGPKGMATGGMASQAHEDTGPALASLVIFAPNTAPVTFELRRGVVSIGRGLENNVVLSDPYSSRKHLLIVHRNDQFEVRDSGTDNGTCINGQRVSQALLRPGDHVEVGSTVMRFVWGQPSQHDMMFGPAPQRPPHHLTAPPDAVSAQASAVMPVAQPPKRNVGLIVLLVFLLLVLVGGGAAVAIYVLAFSKSASTTSSESETKEEPASSTSDLSTGYQQSGAPDDAAAKMKERALEHDRQLAAEAAGGGTEAAGSAAGAVNAGGDGQPAPQPAAADAAADPVLVAGLVGSVAMATGKVKPLPVTILGTFVTVKIESDPIDAEIFDANGNLRGRTPYEATELQAEHVEEWTIKKVGFQDATVKVSYKDGTEENVSLGKRAAERRRRERRGLDRPLVPTVD